MSGHAGRSMNPEDNPTCIHCKSMDLDLQLRAVFKVMVCSKCKVERPDEYSLLTKTECREDYLLTERTYRSSLSRMDTDEPRSQRN